MIVGTMEPNVLPAVVHKIRMTMATWNPLIVQFTWAHHQQRNQLAGH